MYCSIPSYKAKRGESIEQLIYNDLEKLVPSGSKNGQRQLEEL